MSKKSELRASIVRFPYSANRPGRQPSLLSGKGAVLWVERDLKKRSHKGYQKGAFSKCLEYRTCPFREHDPLHICPARICVYRFSQKLGWTYWPTFPAKPWMLWIKKTNLFEIILGTSKEQDGANSNFFMPPSGVSMLGSAFYSSSAAMPHSI